MVLLNLAWDFAPHLLASVANIVWDCLQGLSWG